jgi:gliding motility-associated-like protein
VAPAGTAALRFVPNQRQWARPVLFAADVPAGQLFLEKGRLLVARYDARQVDHLHHDRAAARTARVRAHAYAVNFEGANPQATAGGEQATGAVTNYFIGNDSTRWATNLPSYAGVRYRQLYPGTDLHLYSHGASMEYDFELAPGADAGRIKLRYEGQESLTVVDGALHIGTSVGRVTEQKPFAYQVIDGRRVAVPCQYVLGPRHTVSFGLPKGYDHSKPLTIDPVLVYATYSGSTGQNWGYTATHDTLGNLYTGGIVFRTGYPTTTGAYDTSFNGGIDIVISGYNPRATTGAASLMSSTYLGGSDDEYVHSLVMSQTQAALVLLGSTASTNFPVSSNAYDRTYNGGTSDLVLARLNFAVGGTTLNATYVGGSAADGQMSTSSNLYANFGDDYRGDVIMDPGGNVYFASVTRSNNFPTSGGQPFRGGHEAVVMKFNPSFTALGWGTYLGGSGDDAGYSIQLDSVANVYVAGGTTSNTLPASASGLNASYRGGIADGFVARLTQNLTTFGVTVQQSTYLGTTSYDQAYFVQLDRKAAVYVLGQTNGAYPVTAGTYRNANSRQFIHKLTNQLNATGYSTIFGNGAGTATSANPYPTNLSPTAFLVDNCGNLLLSGYGASSIAGMPTTADALLRTVPNSTPSSQAEANLNTYGYLYLMQLSPNARRLVYATYYGTGTTHVDGGTSRFDKKGIIYQAICVRAQQSGGAPPTIPLTANAYARAIGTGAGTNAAALKMDIVRLDASFVPAANGVANTRTGCAPLTVTFTRATPSSNGTTWNFGNGQTSTQPNNVTATYTAPGRYPVTLTAYDSTSCQPAVISRDTVTVLGLPRAALGPDQTVCPGSSATLTVAGATPVQSATYQWSPTTGLNITFGPTVVATPTVTTQYIVTATTPGGCVSRDTIVVNVRNILTVTIPAVAALCTGASATLTASDAGPGATYTWSPAAGLSSTTGRSVTATPAATTTYTVRATTAAGCTGSATVTVTVNPLTVTVPTVAPICPGASATLTAADAGIGATYTWSPAAGLSSTTGRTVTATPAATTTYTMRVTTAAGCTASATTTVTVTTPPAIAILANATQVRVGETVAFGASGPLVTPLSTLSWDFGDGQTGRGLTLSHAFAAPGTYTVRLLSTSATGCPGSTAVTITVLAREFQYPNVITPNNDGQNDDFRPYVSPEPVSVVIFNRWGRKVFEQENYTQGWGREAGIAAGMYYYQLRSASGQTWKGWLEVVK